MCGKLILIVGPSGVGKDTLLDTAKEYLAEDDHCIFPRRYITRAADAGGENHRFITDEDFNLLQGNKGFALHWEAHGFRYGIPISALRDVKSGNTVIVNVSRSVIDKAREVFPNVSVAYITARPEILRSRLISRGRESSDEIEHRVAKASAYDLSGTHIHMIDNSGSLETAVQDFVAIISSPAVAA